jgi:choline dehydrogenase-like flavoprotein
VANCGLRFEPMGEVQKRSLTTQAKEMAKGLICASDVVADFVRTVGNFFCPRPPEAGRLRAAAEQVPNRNSRVRLIDDTDQFGLRRIALDWHLSAMDKKTMREIGMAAGRYLAQQDIGRVKLYHWLFDEDDFVPGLEDNQELAGFHHLGTTRMASSKDDGVVDAHCRVFGVDNLYIAGSSVFRTGGHANPTLTIVQLTLRLADHLTRA